MVGTCVRASPCFQAANRRLPSTPYACYLMESHLHADTKMACCACLTCANQGATLLALPFVPKSCLISSRSAPLLLQCSFGFVAAKCPCHHANCGTKSFWRRLPKAAVGLQYVHYLCLPRSNSLFHCCIVFFFEFALVSSAFFFHCWFSVDGAATEWAMAADGTVSIEREYCGPNCEPVNGLAFASSTGGAAALATLLSASDDGVVRAYQRY